jgi:hypothetical protein
MELRRSAARAPGNTGHGVGDGDGVRANARLTGTTGAILFVLFALEGLTIVGHVGGLLSWHVFLGMMLVPPVLLKTGTTSYRIFRYYTGDPAYVRKGPPPILLRLLGPLVILTTLLVVATGVALLLAGGGHQLGLAHKVSFVLWFAVMALHVLGHLRETPSLASADYRRHYRVPGATARRAVVVVVLVLGVALGAWSLSWIGATWRHG